LNQCYIANLNEEPGICLFWTTLWLITTSGIHRVLEYLIRYSIEESRPFRSSALSFLEAKSPQRELSLLWNFRSVELGNERSKNFRSVEHLLPWNFCFSGANVLRTFVPMKLLFHENEYSKNFRSKCPKTRRETGYKPYNSLRALITSRKKISATDLLAMQCWHKGVISTGN